MINKKEVRIFFLIIISLLFLNFLAVTPIKAQETPPAPYGINPENIEETKNKAETKWDYLGQEWKAILLKNKFISTIDNLLKKINIIFVVLFGQPYSISFTLFFTITLWFIFFIIFSKALNFYSVFSEGTSAVISLAFTTIFAQLQILRKISNLFGLLIFSDKPWWISIILTVLLIIIFVTLIRLYSSYLKTIKKHKEEIEEKREKQKEKLDRKLLHIIVEGFSSVFRKG